MSHMPYRNTDKISRVVEKYKLKTTNVPSNKNKQLENKPTVIFES